MVMISPVDLHNKGLVSERTFDLPVDILAECWQVLVVPSDFVAVFDVMVCL